MQIKSLSFKGNGCFVADWVGFQAIRPINVIIGRNNTGKSQLLELVRISCEGIKQPAQWEFLCSAILDKESLQGQFPENHSDGELLGNHWRHNGRFFIGVPIEWEVRKGGGMHNFKIREGYT